MYVNFVLYTDDKKKRYADVNEDGLTYGDFFSGYPSGMKIRKDVAEFVRMEG